MKHAFRIEAIHPGYAVELAERQQIADKKMMEDDDRQKPDDDDEKAYSVIDGVGVYKISGPLLSTGNFFTRMFGMADYEGVRNDLVQMAQDTDVQDIMILMASPGGSVFGVSNAAEAVKKVNAIKPITVYTGKNCCSGAYWLAANANQIIAAPEAEVGSIGVIVTHMSYEKQLEDEGIQVTIIKSDELKAVGGPFKSLTDKEISHIQSQVDQYADLFHNHIQSARPQVKLSSMKGQTFIGAEAVKMGLADAVMSYDDAINHIKSQRKTTQTGGYNMKMTAEQLRAALDAGQTLADIGLTDEEANEILAITPEIKEDGLEVDAAKKPKKGGKGGGCADPEGEVLEGDDAAPEMHSMPVTEFETLMAEFETLKSANAALTAKAEATLATAEKMRGIVTDIFNNRRIALNLGALDVSGMSLETLLADFEATTAQFQKSFKIGGSLKPEPKAAPKSILTDSVHAGLMQAAAVR